MSKIKIYDGVVIDMATSNIIKEGKVSYANSDQVAYTKGVCKDLRNKEWL